MKRTLTNNEITMIKDIKKETKLTGQALYVYLVRNEIISR